MRDIIEIGDFNYDELVEISGEPEGTLGVTYLEHLQRLFHCQRIACSKVCDSDVPCGVKNHYGEDYDHCYYLNSKTMTEGCLIELASLMKKDNDSNKITEIEIYDNGRVKEYSKYYPELNKAVEAHDAISNSIWYSLKPPAYEEWLKFKADVIDKYKDKEKNE